ncbi:MAG: hypothetical protein ACRDP5_28630 [Streptosporangiaceae bacterium]
MTEDGKHQDIGQLNEYERALIDQLNLLEAVDRLMTPAHIARRFEELRQAIAGDAAVHPQFAAAAMVGGRDISRTADSAMDTSRWLTASASDLRAMNPSSRAETEAVLAELRELLRRCPAGAYGAEASAMILSRVAILAEALIADRDERAAVRLIQVAAPHLELLGRCHPVTFEVRRAYAEALCERGHYRWAHAKLRQLSEDERRVFGSDDPRTALLLLWALVSSKRLQQAERGFGTLQERLAQLQDVSPLIQWHVQCRYSWLLGQLGLVSESASSYDRVFRDRSRRLGADHPDTLDALHSQGKMLVLAGDGLRAGTLLAPVADQRQRVQGDRHPDTLETLKYLHLADALAEPRDGRVLRYAIAELEEIMAIQANRHGPDYPMTLDTAARLGELRERQEAIRFREPIPGLRHVPILDLGQVPALAGRGHAA